MILNFFQILEWCVPKFFPEKKLHLESFLQMQTSSAVVRSTSLRFETRHVEENVNTLSPKSIIRCLNCQIIMITIQKIYYAMKFFFAFLNIIHLFFC